VNVLKIVNELQNIVHLSQVDVHFVQSLSR
jgi:hypothetical protein